MPYRLAGPCAVPGCPHKGTTRGRCAEHAATTLRQQEAARGTRQTRGYDAAWYRLVARKKRETPFCVLCGATEDLTGDHIVPLSRGGQSVYENIRILCRPHNSSKGAR